MCSEGWNGSGSSHPDWLCFRSAPTSSRRQMLSGRLLFCSLSSPLLSGRWLSGRPCRRAHGCAPSTLAGRIACFCILFGSLPRPRFFHLHSLFSIPEWLLLREIRFETKGRSYWTQCRQRGCSCLSSEPCVLLLKPCCVVQCNTNLPWIPSMVKLPLL